MEFTYTELRRGVDELELDLLEIPARGVHHEGLADGDNTLLGSGDRALEHNVIILDDTVMREAAERSNSLDGGISISGPVLFNFGSEPNAVDLLVELSTVMVSVCGESESHACYVGFTRTYFDQHEQR